MKKVRLNVEELAVESFGVDAEVERGTVNANEFARPRGPWNARVSR